MEGTDIERNEQTDLTDKRNDRTKGTSVDRAGRRDTERASEHEQTREMRGLEGYRPNEQTDEKERDTERSFRRPSVNDGAHAARRTDINLNAANGPTDTRGRRPNGGMERTERNVPASTGLRT